MYLHLFYDSPFAEHIIRYCNQQNQKNVYVVFAKELKHLKSTHLVQRYDNYESLKRTNIRATDFHKVFVHFLGNSSIEFVLDNKGYKNFYWFFWGADGYDIPELKFDLYLPETKRYIASKESLRSKLKRIGRGFQNFFFESKGYKAFQQIAYCCTWVDGDFELAKKLNHKINYYRFSYLSEKELFLDCEDSRLVLSNQFKYKVLLGNSLNYTNNHLDAIAYLKKLNLTLESVVMPLSYSGEEAYKKRVKSTALASFGDQCVFLDNFVPLDEYIKLLSTVDFVIFYHLRQQAANNTLILLWMGKLVIMNKESSLFKTFQLWGLSVVEHDKISNRNDLCHWDNFFADRQEKNRTILKSVFSEDKVNEYYKGLFVD